MNLTSVSQVWGWPNAEHYAFCRHHHIVPCIVLPGVESMLFRQQGRLPGELSTASEPTDGAACTFRSRNRPRHCCVAESRWRHFPSSLRVWCSEKQPSPKFRNPGPTINSAFHTPIYPRSLPKPTLGTTVCSWAECELVGSECRRIPTFEPNGTATVFSAYNASDPLNPCAYLWYEMQIQCFNKGQHKTNEQRYWRDILFPLIF